MLYTHTLSLCILSCDECSPLCRSWRTCFPHGQRRPSSLETPKRSICKITTWTRARHQVAAERPTMTAQMKRVATMGQECSVPTSSLLHAHSHTAHTHTNTLETHILLAELQSKQGGRSDWRGLVVPRHRSDTRHYIESWHIEMSNVVIDVRTCSVWSILVWRTHPYTSADLLRCISNGFRCLEQPTTCRSNQVFHLLEACCLI